VYWGRYVEVFGCKPRPRLDVVTTAFKVADAPLYCVSIATPTVLFQESGLFIAQVTA
jgi:hypothetical protein